MKWAVRICKKYLTEVRSRSSIAQGLDVVLRALSDPIRRQILVSVRDHEIAAGAIARRFADISRPAVSQHLRVLEAAELVTVRAEGNRRLYLARPERLAAARDFIETMWCGSPQCLQRPGEAHERATMQPKQSTSVGEDR